MKKILLKNDGADGGSTPSPVPPLQTPPPEIPNRSVKSNMVKVRATGQPVHVNGVHVTSNPKETFEVPEKELPRFGKLLTRVGCILFALALATQVASAQQYTANPLGNGANSLNGGTNIVAASSTATYDYIITATKYGDMAIQPSFALMSSGTSSVTFNFDESLDAVTWQSSAFSIVLAASGTSAITTNVNVNLNSIGYLRLHSIVNANAAIVTNVTVKVGLKPSRFGS